ncbi:unnamed protein product, partial [Ascophyllum nodosum]
TDVFQASSAAVSIKSALFVAWGQLLTYDISLTIDNSTEPFDVPCNDVVDVWCPLGASSDEISFDRSNAGMDNNSVRSPINYATAYINLDFVYGRNELDAEELRTLEGGMMNITENGVPFRNADGTWLVAPYLGYEGDEGIFQACRGWTIAAFQHVTDNDFLILLLGGSIFDYSEENKSRRRLGDVRESSYDERLSSPGVARSRRRLSDNYSDEDYDDSVNVGADVFFTTVAAAALESSLPATVRVVSEGYFSTDDDNIELVVAREDMAGLFERNDVGDILRGALLSPALSVNTYYVAAVTNLSPLFKLPVDAVQRGRDHGLPTYNAAREASHSDARSATDFSEVTSDVDLAALLSNSYGGGIDNLDALTGALAESSSPKSGSLLGELLHASWVEQLSRTIAGDRLHHQHERPIEDLRLTTLSGLIERTTNVTDLPLAVFGVPGVAICGGNCETFGQSEATLSDSFAISWELIDDENIALTLRAKGIGSEGMMGIGWGGNTMYTAQDYAICEVLSEDEAECIDRSSVSSRSVPPPDNVDPSLTVTGVTVGEEWTTVTFVRPRSALDDQDYDVGQDIDGGVDTNVIYAFRKGAGLGQHPNANRGAAAVNFATGDVETECDDNLMFVSLHGALMLVAWLLIAPLGIYFIRYRKGDTIRWAGREWYEMREELMIVASEAVLPLGITAYFHIWAGRFAYVAGVVQCYRGLELVSADDNLVFSAGDGLDLKLGTFGKVQDYVFPVWFAVIAVSFLVCEGRKQYYRYFRKGAAKGCGCVEVINDEYYAEGGATMDRLVPRIERAPLYTVAEFNDKVKSGSSETRLAPVARTKNGPRATRAGREWGSGSDAGKKAPHRCERKGCAPSIEDGFSRRRPSGELHLEMASLTEDTVIRPNGQRCASFEAPHLCLNILSELPSVPPATPCRDSWSTSRSLLERFHVCPLLFRERLEGSVGDNLPSDRPVYRYIFQCPGPAQALVQAITGVCYVNMQGVIQRAYNAYAVRVQGLEPTTPGGERVDGDKAGGLGAGELRILPARETSEGMLCVETRIRLYPDGAMSKLLDELAGHRDNPAVRLQGPFVIQKLVPPPLHRNVVMIAAGTGINPMVQQIRDYVASSETEAAVAGRPSRARLVLLWQATHQADLYGFDEIRVMQARRALNPSAGQLEATVLISGDHRRVNIPGLTFRNKAWAAKSNTVEPCLASPALSLRGSCTSRPIKALARPPRTPWEEAPVRSPNPGKCGDEESYGKVVVSGPRGFVSYVETLLAEMGVPPESLVLLD